MLKTEAIALLGGTAKSASEFIGCTPNAIHMWPDVLTPIIRDRVLAVQARRYLPPYIIGGIGERPREPMPYPPDPSSGCLIMQDQIDPLPIPEVTYREDLLAWVEFALALRRRDAGRSPPS